MKIINKNEDKEDLRVIRTRKLLSTALFDLMAEKDFSQITVNDICEKAMVRRATFYNHFKDKEDLLNYTLDGIQEELFEKSIENSEFVSGKEMYMSLIGCVIDFLVENNDKIVKIRKNCSDKMIISFLETIKRSAAYLIGKNKFNENYKIPVEVIASFFTGGLILIGLDWIDNKQPYSKSELLRFCDTLLDDELLIDHKI